MRGAVVSATALTGGLQRLHKGFIDLRNFTEIERTKPVITDGKIKAKPPLTIEFDNVSFRYPRTNVLVLKNISFVINPDSHIALVGSNGSGKTTLLKLIMRQYLPTKGTIKVNGYHISDIKLDDYYDLISHLGQEFFLSKHLTIKQNLLLGVNKAPTAKEIKQALGLAKAYTFVSKLPEALKTRLDPSLDHGSNISTGQRQRLCVARALLKKASLLILDEPTSAIDAKAEAEIFDNIYSQQADKSIFVISHRFNTVKKADNILVLDKGKIVEQGSHRQLMANNHLYKEAFETQARDYH